MLDSRVKVQSNVLSPAVYTYKGATCTCICKYIHKYILLCYQRHLWTNMRHTHITIILFSTHSSHTYSILNYLQKSRILQPPLISSYFALKYLKVVQEARRTKYTVSVCVFMYVQYYLWTNMHHPLLFSIINHSIYVKQVTKTSSLKMLLLLWLPMNQQTQMYESVCSVSPFHTERSPAWISPNEGQTNQNRDHSHLSSIRGLEEQPV